MFLRWVGVWVCDGRPFFKMVRGRKILLYNSDPKIPQGFSEILLYNSEREIHGGNIVKK